MSKYQVLRRLASVTTLALFVTGLGAASGQAVVQQISLGKAKNYALVVGGGLTNTGQSSINGDLALTPTISYSDTGLLTLKGDYHFGDSAAIAAQSDVTTAYNAAVAETPSVVVGSELAGQTLLPGIYTNAVTLSINGVLNLDAQNNPNALFILQTPANLSTGAASKVNLLNGAQPCNVFWQVGTSTSLGAGSDLKGNILGKGAFTSSAGSVIQGRVLISQGSVALNATQINLPDCKDIKAVSPNYLGTGAGSYTSQYGNAVFNFVVKGIESPTASFTGINGRVGWSANKAWSFTGVPTAFTYVNGVGTITGTGNIAYYASPKKEKERRWLSATSGSVNFTIKFTRVINSNGTLGKVNTFAIGFTGIPIAGVPQLPTLGALTQVKGGGDRSDD